MVLDTNVFIAAAFRPTGRSARILRAIRDGELTLVWNRETRGETEMILRKVPPVSWDSVAALFEPKNRFDGATDPDTFSFILDPDDRKFAALASAAGAILVSLDHHLLTSAPGVDAPIAVTPADFLQERGIT